MPRPRQKILLLAALAGLLAAPCAPHARARPVTEFGSLEASSSTLIGIFYDLKQSQARERLTINQKIYGKIVDEFVSSGWDEAILNRYFRAPLPLYTTQIFVPIMPAKNATSAFRVDDAVDPSYWIIHYKGQVSAPESGEWRFWGYGEEVCSVAVNGRNVLLSNWHEITTPSAGWSSPRGPGQPAARGHLKAGDWLRLEKGQVIDLDVIIGERAGGVFAAFLLIEKRGADYRMVNGQPVLPVFQLAPHATPQPQAPAKGPVIAADGPIWIGVQ